MNEHTDADENIVCFIGRNRAVLDAIGNRHRDHILLGAVAQARRLRNAYRTINGGGVVNLVNGSTVAEIGEWYHVVATAENGGFMRLYVNGVEEGTAEGIGALWTGGNQYRIGSLMGDGTVRGPYGWFTGTLDEVAFYDRALSADEVLEHYNIGAAIPEPTSLSLLGLAGVTLLLRKRRAH